MLTWPPQVEDLKDERKIPRSDTRDDASLQRILDAAVEFVEDTRAGEFDFSGEPPEIPTAAEIALGFVQLPAPTTRIIQGTLTLAGRWVSRKSSPDGRIDLGDAGSFRISSVDPDIDAMLGIRRSRKPMVG